MPHFPISLGLAALSGGLTYLVSQAFDVALIVGAVVFVAYWFGLCIVAVVDGNVDL